MYTIERTEQQINELLDKALEAFDKGTNYPGMSYEQGILDAIYWLTGQTDDDPLSEV